MNPIIFLWAHPRSMSTAIERVMRERGDFDCLHEPFLHYYYRQRTDKALPHFDGRHDHPRSYAETRDMVLERAEKAPIFARDMSYYVMPEILQDAVFCRWIRHCFLIRNPVYSILSYYRLDPNRSLNEVGIKMQWRQLRGLQALGIDTSLVLEAEAVQRDPLASMSRFWQELGLDCETQALAWKSGTPPPDWRYVQGWHHDVSESSGIVAASAADNQASQDDFEQLCRRVPRLEHYLRHHLPFYRKLRDYSQRGVNRNEP